MEIAAATAAVTITAKTGLNLISLILNHHIILNEKY